MRKIKIITDSCSDLDINLLEKYDIDYVKMNTVYNDLEQKATLTWDWKKPHDFYAIMRNGERITTTQVPQDEFESVFTKYLDLGFDIIYIGCALKQSGSVNSGKVVARQILEKEEYSEAKIECIDSLNATCGEGLLAIYAATLVSKSLSFDEIVKEVLDKRKKIVEYATVGTLDWLRKSGRVTASKAFFGNLFQVKPILIADKDGAQAAYKKAKGRKNALTMIVDLLKENIIDSSNQTIFIGEADCAEEEIDFVKNYIKSNIDCKDIYVLPIGPIVGASVGPDTIGVWAFGKEVTFVANGE